jgi:internalin A
MRRAKTFVLGLGSVVGLFVFAACESKNAGLRDDHEKAAEAVKTAAALPAPPAPAKEVEPVEKEEAPVKKEPKVCPPGKVVDFAGDTALEAQVRLKAAKPKGDVTFSDLGKVRSLNLSQTKVSDLDPCIFPHFTALKELFLGAGKLDDLSPIAELKNLESLRASLNRVTDLKPLAKLTKLDRLDLGHTRVIDISPLSSLTAMTELELDDTPVVDLKPLAECVKLERLSIQRTNVKKLAPLTTLVNLKFLYVSGAPIEDKLALTPLMGKGLKIVE